MKNRCQKNTWFSTLFFLDFSSFWPPKTKPKSSFFRYFFENVDFVKILLPSRRNCYFSGFGPRKINIKSMQNRIRKKHRKKHHKNRFRPPFWFLKPTKICPKSFKIAFQSDAKGSLFRNAMEITRTSSEINGSQPL